MRIKDRAGATGLTTHGSSAEKHTLAEEVEKVVTGLKVKMQAALNYAVGIRNSAKRAYYPRIGGGRWGAATTLTNGLKALTTFQQLGLVNIDHRADVAALANDKKYQKACSAARNDGASKILALGGGDVGWTVFLRPDEEEPFFAAVPKEILDHIRVLPEPNFGDTDILSVACRICGLTKDYLCSSPPTSNEWISPSRISVMREALQRAKEYLEYFQASGPAYEALRKDTLKSVDQFLGWFNERTWQSQLRRKEWVDEVNKIAEVLVPFTDEIDDPNACIIGAARMGRPSSESEAVDIDEI